MDGPLAREMYDTGQHEPSWWEDTAGLALDRPPLETDIRVGTAVIGGGVTGLTAARVLAEAGVAAAVLEAGEIGWGSSGRAGGIVGFGGSKLSDAALRRRFGAAEVAWAETLQAENLRDLRRLAEDAGLGAQIQGTGEAIWAHSRAMARRLATEGAPAGGEAIGLPPSGQDDIARHGGVLIRPSFGIHPLRLSRALADLAEAAGAWVLPRSEVAVWERRGNAHRLVTARGSVTADRVILATNAFTPDRLHPRFRARTVPVISNIAVTRPLVAAERAAHPWLGPEPSGDTRHLLAYFRILPEGRLLFGMRGDLRGSERGRARMRTLLRARLDAALPGLREVEITHFWRGPVCATMARRPSIGRLADEPTVFHGFGWHGSGLNMGTLAGRMLAELILGAPAKSVPAPWRGLPPPVPVPALRPLYVGAMMGAYALEDRLG